MEIEKKWRGNQVIKIFISHCSKDVEILDYIQSFFNSIEIEPIILDDVIEGMPPPQKILKNMKEADLFLIIWTKKVIEDKETESILNHEITQAFTLEVPIFALIEKSVFKPRYFDNLTDYKRFYGFEDFKIQIEKFKPTFIKQRDDIISRTSMLSIFRKKISIPRFTNFKKKLISGSDNHG